MVNVMISVCFLLYRENRKKEIFRKDLSAKTRLLYYFNNLMRCIIATALIKSPATRQSFSFTGSIVDGSFVYEQGISLRTSTLGKY
jgi:hypothetical protein